MGVRNHIIFFLAFTVSTIAFLPSGCKDARNGQIAISTTELIQKKQGFKDVSRTNLISKNLNNNTMDGQSVDIDKDGDLDMVLAIEFGRNVILINDGKGRLFDESDKRFPKTYHDSEDIAISDFDKDGSLDIVFVSEDDQTNEYYRNQGNGFFSDVSDEIPVGGTSNVVVTSDFNLDGFDDLLIGNRGQNVLLINDTRGRFKDETSKRLPKNNATTQDVEVKDIDGDGDLDVIEANENFNRILINNGQGTFVDESEIRLPKVNDQTREVELGDIDNDGDLDIFFANVDFGGVGNPQNRLLLNNGSGFFEEITQTSLPQSNFRTVGATFFDVNKDNFLDLVVGNRFNGTEMMVLVNNAKLKFEDRSEGYLPALDCYTFDFEFSDFNQDGIQDVYLCNFRGADMLLFGLIE